MSEKILEKIKQKSNIALVGFIVQSIGFILMSEHGLRYLQFDTAFGHEWLGVIFILLGIPVYLYAGKYGK